MKLLRTDLPMATRSSPGAKAIGAILLGLVASYCFVLWPEWRHNPDLSHGFLSPLIFALLVWESRRLGPLRWIRPGPASVGAQLVLAGGAVILFGLAGLFAASIGWSHALVLFLLGLTLACLLLAGLGLLADERVRLLPLNGINLTAILLFVLVAPLPIGTYARLTLTLQGWVTGGVMDVLQFFGVPARQHGNVIELARATVGVEDACSGVRSLISCIYAGFFLAAWQLRGTWRRLFLIALAPALALLMNLFRSLLLTLLANGGVDIGGAWHDATGYAVLGLTTVILAAVALWLEPKSGQSPASAPPSSAEPAGPLRGAWAFRAGVLTTTALGVFYFTHSRTVEINAPPPPDLAALLPATAPGWQVRTPDDLYQFSDVLQTTHLLQRTYLRQQDARDPVEITVYVAYWPPGQASVSRVASHTPDACWPGSGWVSEQAASRHRQSPELPGLALSPAEYRLFRTDRGFTQYVWFWHVFDGHVIDYRDPYSLQALIQIALQYGFRRQGSQYFVRFSSNRPWSDLAPDPLVHELLANLKATGI